jgi:penicillin amidase
VLAARQGNIGYQQSGAAPRRRHGGPYPVPASDSRYAWDGLLSPETLRSIVNPPEGFIASANSDLDPPAGPRVINLAAGPYRVERIRSLLASRARHSSAQMKQMQADVYSGQAALFMEVLRPLIPDTPAGRLLRAWDLRYEPDSRAAVLFELFYSRLLREVFGMGLLGADLWDSQAAGTDLLANHFHLFDRCLLGQEQVWYGAEGRDVVWRRIIAAVLKETPLAAVAPWGRHQRVVLRNQVFSGKLGRLLGAGYGPVSIPGCRASIAQGSVFHVQGRLVALSQSHRYYTDLGTDQAETALPGGPSGNFWSRYYRCDLARWRKHQYKTLAAEGPARDVDA